MIMVIKRVEYGISYYDLIKENFHIYTNIPFFASMCTVQDMRTFTELISITNQLKYSMFNSLTLFNTTVCFALFN